MSDCSLGGRHGRIWGWGCCREGLGGRGSSMRGGKARGLIAWMYWRVTWRVPVTFGSAVGFVCLWRRGVGCVVTSFGSVMTFLCSTSSVCWSRV